MGTELVSFSDALSQTESEKRQLLLGNGFSIALFPARFAYGSLLEEADFSASPEVRKAFERLATADFEIVIQALRSAASLMPLYSEDATAVARMQHDAEQLKDVLIQAIAGRHPERPSDVNEDQYKACRSFLANFVGESRNLKASGGRDIRGNVYSLNYDLLLYWTLLHDQVVHWNATDPLSSTFETTEELKHDDGFRAPDSDPDAPYVTWEAEAAADNQNIHFLHGALHLYDDGPDLQKKCWDRSGGIALVDQIRTALDEGKFPLFVSEGDSAAKLARIRHSGYLQRSLKSFAGVCRSPKSSLFTFGHSFASKDQHVIRQIENGKIGRLYVSLYGDPTGPHNKSTIERLQGVAASRDKGNALEVGFFDAASAAVWG